MDPVSLTLGAIGLGMQIFGGFSSAANASEMAKVSQDEAMQEQGINNQKQKAMEIDARRQQLEIMRTNQRMQALAATRATSQGAQFGSGLQGGEAQIQDQSAFNLAGVDSSLTIGREINKYNQAITVDKMQMASLGGKSAMDQGFMSLGGAIMKAGPIVGQLSQGFGGSNSFPTNNPYSSTSDPRNLNSLY